MHHYTMKLSEKSIHKDRKKSIYTFLDICYRNCTDKMWLFRFFFSDEELLNSYRFNYCLFCVSQSILLNTE